MSIIYLKAIDRNNGRGDHIIKAEIESVVEDVYQIVDTYNHYGYTFNLKTSLLKSKYLVKNYDCGTYEMQELTEISEIGYLKYRMQKINL
jgi:hypothetical protein